MGTFAALFLLSLAVTGFLLARKGSLSWMRPPVRAGTGPMDLNAIIGPGRAAEIAFAQGHPELRTVKDIDRIDYRPKDNVYKVLSKEGYREVQVDGGDGRVLSDAFRRDGWIEDLHDLSFFGDAAHEWGLPLVAIALGGLAVTGIGLVATPIVRRRRFERDRARGLIPNPKSPKAP